MTNRSGLRVYGVLRAVFALAILASTVRAASGPALEVFVAPWCPYCRALERDLNAKGIPFVKSDVENDPRARQRFEALGGGGLPLSRVGRRLIRGYDLPAIEAALAATRRETEPRRVPPSPRRVPAPDQELTRVW